MHGIITYKYSILPLFIVVTLTGAFAESLHCSYVLCRWELKSTTSVHVNRPTRIEWQTDRGCVSVVYTSSVICYSTTSAMGRLFLRVVLNENNYLVPGTAELLLAGVQQLLLLILLSPVCFLLYLFPLYVLY